MVIGDIRHRPRRDDGEKIRYGVIRNISDHLWYVMCFRGEDVQDNYGPYGTQAEAEAERKRRVVGTGDSPSVILSNP